MSVSGSSNNNIDKKTYIFVGIAAAIIIGVFTSLPTILDAIKPDDTSSEPYSIVLDPEEIVGDEMKFTWSSLESFNGHKIAQFHIEKNINNNGWKEWKTEPGDKRELIHGGFSSEKSYLIRVIAENVMGERSEPSNAIEFDGNSP